MSDERKFLHDIATPIATVYFLLDSVLETLKSRPDGLTLEIQQLEECDQLLNSIKSMLQNRRQILIDRGEK